MQAEPPAWHTPSPPILLAVWLQAPAKGWPCLGIPGKPLAGGGGGAGAGPLSQRLTSQEWRHRAVQHREPIQARGAAGVEPLLSSISHAIAADAFYGEAGKGLVHMCTDCAVASHAWLALASDGTRIAPPPPGCNIRAPGRPYTCQGARFKLERRCLRTCSPPPPVSRPQPRAWLGQTIRLPPPPPPPGGGEPVAPSPPLSSQTAPCRSPTPSAANCVRRKKSNVGMAPKGVSPREVMPTRICVCPLLPRRIIPSGGQLEAGLPPRPASVQSLFPASTQDGERDGGRPRHPRRRKGLQGAEIRRTAGGPRTVRLAGGLHLAFALSPSAAETKPRSSRRSPACAPEGCAVAIAIANQPARRSSVRLGLGSRERSFALTFASPAFTQPALGWGERPAAPSPPA